MEQLRLERSVSASFAIPARVGDNKDGKEYRRVNLQTIGAALRLARETIGASIADVAAALFVTKSIVKAIESGCWDMLPHPVYVKGYVKSYATYLGVSSAVESQLHTFVKVDSQDKKLDIGYQVTFSASRRLSTAFAERLRRISGRLFTFYLAALGIRRTLLPRL